jgi:hypothetical protein
VATICIFSLGLLYANFMEWLIHKHLFHGFGKKKNSLFAFHLREHHIQARNNQFFDTKLTKRETLGLCVLLILQTPLYFYISPAFYAALVVYGSLFAVLHKVQHVNPKFAKKYFWWHWNHHMHNQNKSWNVVLPVTDLITGTLEARHNED